MRLDGVIDAPTWTFDYGFDRGVYPTTRGSGPRLFPEDAAPGNLSLAPC